MHHRTQLPDTLGTAFTVQDAAAAGIGRGRIAARDLTRPFHGTRTRKPIETPPQRVAGLVPRLRPGQLIGGMTAMRLWGYPHPGTWRLTDAIEVVVATGAVRPRTSGVIGRRLACGRARGWLIGSIPVVDPIAAMFMCAGRLTRDQLVVAIDALITTADNYPGLREGRPHISADDIATRLLEWGRFPGCAKVRAAVGAARERVESPKETQTRLQIVAAGLPEPEVQFTVLDDGRFVARVDLAYPHVRIAIEYEGDGHRTDRDQWRRDIQRQRHLEELGWIVIRATELDLRDGGTSLVRRIRRSIASR